MRARISSQRFISANISIFHSFFHRCGKLWRETKRAWNHYGRKALRKTPTVTHSSIAVARLSRVHSSPAATHATDLPEIVNDMPNAVARRTNQFAARAAGSGVPGTGGTAERLTPPEPVR